MAAALALTLSGVALGVAPALASPVPHTASSAPCNASVTAGTGTVFGSFIVGATAGTTQVSFDCDTATGAALAAQVSLLAGVGSSAVMLASEADTAAIATFAPAASDTGCPAGTAGACSTATFAVPATFAAADAKASCPPTQAEENAGIFGCVVAVATAQDQPLAEYLMTYASQTSLPASPTIAATVSAGPAASTITVSDAAANSGFWWANAIQQSQALALGATPDTLPASCAVGYGDVPSPFLAVNFIAQGTSTGIAGSAAGVSISNACYDGTTLNAPVLSGTIPVPAALTDGTSYSVYLCELNLTPFPSNDASAAAHCGAAPPGESWIDATFSFTATAGTPQPALSVTSLSGMVGTPLTLATSGGAGSGAVSYVAVNGTATGCQVTGATLSASSPGTCVVTASKASDSADLGVSSTPATVSFTALPVEQLVTTHATLTGKSKTLGIKISCSGAPCSGTLTAKIKPVLFTRKSGHPSYPAVFNLGPTSYSIAAGATATVTLHLTSAFEKFLAGNPNRPVQHASIEITDNLGKKHNTIGRVSLLK